jgi:hypothetical protein
MHRPEDYTSYAPNYPYWHSANYTQYQASALQSPYASPATSYPYHQVYSFASHSSSPNYAAFRSANQSISSGYSTDNSFTNSPALQLTYNNCNYASANPIKNSIENPQTNLDTFLVEKVAYFSISDLYNA